MAWVLGPVLSAAATYTSYADARPILTALAEILPAELKTGPSPDAAWSAWAARHDRDIRTRLDRGDDDTIVNWLLLGSTFTTQPPLVLTGATSAQRAILDARLRDLIAALQSPGADERRLFARSVLARKGFALGTAAARERVADHLLAEVARTSGEQATWAREIEAARRLNDTSAEFAARSRLFRDRGISLDTSLLPGFAIERALRELRARGLLAPGAVRDVAVLGPGLDFSDKVSGFDFYPLQTLQPFTLVDSLVRVGLIKEAAAVRVTTLDLSQRVNGHLSALRQRASAGQPYLLRLPLDTGVAWTPEVLAYWKAAGDRIGAASAPAAERTQGADVRVRTVRVPPAVAQRIDAEDVNVVVQRLADRRFDLVIATNVFVYYDVLDQVLAMANLAAMMRPGAFLLSNNALLELPSSSLRSVDYLTVQYSDRPDDGDHIVWYQAK